MLAVVTLIVGVFGYLITCEICDYLERKHKRESEEE